MGWPNNDPERWNIVCAEAVTAWYMNEYFKYAGDLAPTVYELVEFLQSEHSDIFDALLMQVDASTIDGATNDYFMAKYGGEQPDV